MQRQLLAIHILKKKCNTGSVI